LPGRAKLTLPILDEFKTEEKPPPKKITFPVPSITEEYIEFIVFGTVVLFLIFLIVVGVRMAGKSTGGGECWSSDSDSSGGMWSSGEDSDSSSDSVAVFLEGRRLWRRRGFGKLVTRDPMKADRFSLCKDVGLNDVE